MCGLSKLELLFPPSNTYSPLDLNPILFIITGFSYDGPGTKLGSKNKDVSSHCVFEIPTEQETKNRYTIDGEKKNLLDFSSKKKKNKHLRKQNINMLCLFKEIRRRKFSKYLETDFYVCYLYY